MSRAQLFLIIRLLIDLHLTLANVSHNLMAKIDKPVDLHQMHLKVYWIFFQGSRYRPCYLWL